LVFKTLQEKEKKMIKAHSLLYAIYISLLIALLTAGIIYFSNVYKWLNIYYNTNEDLIIENQSALNFSLKNSNEKDSIYNERKGFSNITNKQNFGLFKLLKVTSFNKKDTVISTHFLGGNTKNMDALFLANFSKSLSFFGDLKLIGETYLPNERVNQIYVNNSANSLFVSKKIMLSQIQLPKLDTKIEETFNSIFDEIDNGNLTPLKLTIINSFTNKTQIVKWHNNTNNLTLKGNLILFSNDSIVIKKNDVLEDIIVFSPKIRIEEGFTGNVQLFSNKEINISKNVKLKYPSSVVLFNNSKEESNIKIEEEVRICGSILLFGNELIDLDKNRITILSKGQILGDIYCTGKLNLQSNVYGSVYTNRLFLEVNQTSYDNTLANIEINPSKLPNFYYRLPLFVQKNTNYEVIKKTY
jgi:hypothetical protein